MMSKNITTRMRRWKRITGLYSEPMAGLAATAAAGYANYECGYGSGYEAGCSHAEHLPEGSRSSDSRLRAWGDFLIDLGDL